MSNQIEVVWGLSTSTWNVLGVIGSILSGIATFMAVATSLYLIRRASTFRGKLTVGISYLLPSERKYLQIQLVNLSERTMKVTGIGWRIVPQKNGNLFHQVFDGDLYLKSSPLPILLSPGEDGIWYVYLEDDNWFSNSMQHQHARPKRVFLYCGFSDGSRFEVRVQDGISKKFVEGYERAHSIKSN